jgi:antitoxin component YwqK of YwqJK toxin-antitoxin module
MGRGRVFSNTLTIEIKGQAAERGLGMSSNQASLEIQDGSIHQPDEAKRKIEKVYYLNGSLFSETDLFSDRYNGFYKTYHKDGGIDTELRYKDGRIIYNQAFDRQGRPIYRHGLIKTYYADGSLYEEIFYKKDMKNGLEKVYYYDGKTVVAQGHYWNNRKVGVHQICDPAGRLREEIDWGYPTGYVRNLYKTIWVYG